MTEGIRVLGEFISRKQTNLSALTSIVEVKVETALVSEEKQGKSRLSEHNTFHFMFQNIVMVSSLCVNIKNEVYRVHKITEGVYNSKLQLIT